MNYRVPAALGATLSGLACLLVGCSARTDVSLTGNTPAQYSHVWITTQEIWVNASATAGPDDSGWRKFPLSTPATVDLVGQNGGTLGSIVTGLNIEPGTYSQLRLIPLDSSAALTASAQAAGALSNAEADFVSAGNTIQLPLEMLNPEKGIGIVTSLRVPVGNVGAAVGAATRGIGTGTTTGTDASFVNASGSSPFATTTTSTGTTTVTAGSLTPTTTTMSGTTTLGTASTSTTGTGTTSTTPTPNEFAIAINGNTDLVPFTFATTSGPASGIMLSSHAAAFDLTRVGAISGTLTLTNLSSSTSNTGLPAIEASAEVLSADGSRHVVVSSTPVHADGTFMLYPLAAGSSSNSPDDYDVVIHGPGIATIIIKSVQVFQARVTSTTTVPSATTQSTTAAIDTNTSTTSTTSGTSTTITPVSLGTLIPRAATAFSANLTPPATPLPAGAAVSFYQTLGGKGEVPYVIETAAIDPFNQNLATPQSLSTGTVDSGTWSSSGASITVVSAAPAQGAGGYTVAASAPSFADGALTTKVSAPGSPSTTPVPVPALPAMQFASGVTQGTVTATVSLAAPGKYDHGELLLTHNGTLVASTPIDAVLKAGGNVTLSAVPAGTPDAVYYVAVRAWLSSDPTATLHRQSVAGALNLSSSSSGAVQLTLN